MRVGREVVPASKWVGTDRVIIGEVRVLRHVHFFKHFGRIFKGVAVSNGPLVVRTNVDHGEVTLHFAGINPEVWRQVVHHRTSNGLLAFELFRVHLLVGVETGCFEVVTQAQGVTHFVAHQLGKQGSDKPLGDAVQLCAVITLGGKHGEVFTHQPCESHVRSQALGGHALGASSGSTSAVQSGVVCDRRLSGVGGHGRPGIDQFRATGWRSHQQSWIPMGVGVIPLTQIRAHAFGHDVRGVFVVPAPVGTDPSVGQNNVSVKDFTRQRVGP